MTGGLSKNLHGVGIGPLSKILAVKSTSVFLVLMGCNFGHQIILCGDNTHKVQDRKTCRKCGFSLQSSSPFFAEFLPCKQHPL